jgi:hypothetical protein
MFDRFMLKLETKRDAYYQNCYKEQVDNSLYETPCQQCRHNIRNITRERLSYLSVQYLFGKKRTNSTVEKEINPSSFVDNNRKRSVFSMTKSCVDWDTGLAGGSMKHSEEETKHKTQKTNLQKSKPYK